MQRNQHKPHLEMVGGDTNHGGKYDTNHGGKDRSIMLQVKTPATAKERHRRASFIIRMQHTQTAIYVMVGGDTNHGGKYDTNHGGK